MALGHQQTLDHARELTRIAAQWLVILSFSAFRGATVFSSSMCHYHAMLDPAATDAQRLASCRAMRDCVRRRAEAEDLEGKAKRLQERPVDPYDAHWHTTRDGASLWMIVHLLDCAISGFEAEALVE